MGSSIARFTAAPWELVVINPTGSQSDDPDERRVHGDRGEREVVGPHQLSADDSEEPGFHDLHPSSGGSATAGQATFCRPRRCEACRQPLPARRRRGVRALLGITLLEQPTRTDAGRARHSARKAVHDHHDATTPRLRQSRECFTSPSLVFRSSSPTSPGRSPSPSTPSRPPGGWRPGAVVTDLAMGTVR